MTTWIALLVGMSVALGCEAFFYFQDAMRMEERFRRLTGRTSARSFELFKKRTAFFSRRFNKNLIWKQLPDAFELLALALSTGQNFERSFELTVKLIPIGPMKNEFAKTLELLHLGRSREDTLLDFKRRLHEDRVSGSFALILQSLKRGSPLQSILFEQAASFRREQMREVERRAQTVGLRLLFPIMIFIFPTLFLLLFGSLYLTYLKNGSFF